PAPIDDLFTQPMAAGSAVLNGAGELTGSVEIAEWGMLETPVLLTGTIAVGRCYDAVVSAVFDAVPEAGNGVEDVVIPVVGECDDSWLDDARARNVRVEDALAALRGATSDAPALGAVGAGAGMIAFDCKAGIGSASRRVDELDATVGVLVLANFGSIDRLTVDGAPVGRRLAAQGFGRGNSQREPAGSCIVVVATDAPLDAHGCSRLARRAGLGLARIGSIGHHGSGEIFLAFSTTSRSPRAPRFTEPMTRPAAGSWIDPLFAGVVEATEEAVLDALCVANTVEGRDGRVAPALPVESLHR
ncbi:MAG: family peptidase, partial [Actinomycetia bacterium]|nr:family peptidase [Actinomycetes bacterium]